MNDKIENKIQKKKLIGKLIRISILLLFSVIFALTIINGSVYNFVHKRHIPMIIFSIIVFLIFAIVEMIYRKSFQHNYKKNISLLIFIIPIILYFFSGDGLKLSSVAQNTELKNQFQTKQTEKKQQKPNPFTGMPKITMKLSDGRIVLNNENFSKWLTEIYQNSYLYFDTEIELSGELWYEEDLPENEFAVGRFMMLCCAADMQAVGLLCKAKNKPKQEDGEWVKIKGILKEKIFNEEESEPYIEVLSIEKAQRPENSYIYPF